MDFDYVDVTLHPHAVQGLTISRKVLLLFSRVLPLEGTAYDSS